MRSALVSGAKIFTGDPGGTFGTALPVPRADRSTRACESGKITGFTGRGGASTADFAIQEDTGLPAAVTVDFLAPDGTGTVETFAHRRIEPITATRDGRTTRPLPSKL